MKRWSPPPKVQPKAGKPITSTQQAVRAAKRGETDAALSFLLPRAQKENFAAAATTIQLLAFRGRWRELVPLTITVLAEEPEASAGREACCAACDLVWRASTELNDASIIEAAKSKLARSMKAEALPRLLGERASPKQATPEDRVRFVEHANDPKTEKRFRGKPGSRAAHLMAYAHLHLGLEDELLELWAPKHDELRFREASWVARALARRGETQRAWEVLESRLGTWWPSTVWDVAPVELLVDPALTPLMTKERCELVLSTIRAEEA